MLFWSEAVVSWVVPAEPPRIKLVRDLVWRFACRAMARLPPVLRNEPPKVPVVFCFLVVFLSAGRFELLEVEARDCVDSVLLRAKTF
jgi:hypothetical protein